MYKKNVLLYLTMIVVAIYGSIIILVIIDKLEWFDKPIMTYIQSLENPLLTEYMKFFSLIGSMEGVVLISLIVFFVLYFSFKYRSELLFLSLTILGSAILNEGLKQIFHRERPESKYLIEAVGFSFPSGHSMAAFTLYVTLSYLLLKHTKSIIVQIGMILFTIFMILMIGISRVYLGVHYPSDVIGGYLTSALWVSFSIFLYRKKIES